jgi:hypothetical protein
VTFRNGGWLVLLAVVVFLAGGVWQTMQILGARSEPKMGDGENVATYGFDLSALAVPEHLVAATSLPRDGLERLDFPPLMDVDLWSAEWSKGRHRKYLVPSDRVVGVVVDGITRAYPLRLLVWHEVVNDTLAGIPIAVTYAPLADGAMVLDRRSLRVPGAGATDGAGARGEANAPLVGYSGLVYDGCPLVYTIDATRAGTDDGETAIASLVSPLGLRAVSGPAARAGVRPEPIPFAVTTWGDWMTTHPQTLVVEPTLEYIERYRSDPYHNYYGNDLLEDYPVEPRLPETERNKAHVLALIHGRDVRVLSFATIAANAGDGGTWTTSIGDVEATIGYRADPPAAWVLTPESGDVVGVSCFAWAWAALHPDGELEAIAPVTPTSRRDHS